MADRPFRNPLLAKLEATSHYTIRSAWEGLEYLNRYWRGDRNASYNLALHVCRDAVDGWVSPERAREALKRALKATDLLIPRSRHLPPKFRISQFTNIRSHPASVERPTLTQSSIVMDKCDNQKTSDRSNEAFPYAFPPHRGHVGKELHVQVLPRGSECQSAYKFDPVSASNFDPFARRDLRVALDSSELAGIAETRRARAA
ncbi:MAG: DUF982 domain-containing protein [Rhizobiales bacterium]|nr:DUF982 domain-containing protein [Hyphomicrobiales bacterium]